ncbi:hypothetical protein CRE_19435 [Caenorhabditis remanei]|uniref:Uncharacterized protein n=1 Tax=Caenorhabditis remanei TaxID=31234 RepID=E3NA29_CAERE|nr:hypothetical protein CRE_19435 [Caenorhabditis remanei]
MQESKTAVVRVIGFANPLGQFQYSMHWGIDHINNYKTAISGYEDVHHVELHAARQAVKMAKKQKLTRIIIRTGSRFVWDLIKNSANFANAPPEVLHLVQAIHDNRKHILIKVELIVDHPENETIGGEMNKENI